MLVQTAEINDGDGAQILLRVQEGEEHGLPAIGGNVFIGGEPAFAGENSL